MHLLTLQARLIPEVLLHRLILWLHQCPACLAVHLHLLNQLALYCPEVLLHQ